MNYSQEIRPVKVSNYREVLEGISQLTFDNTLAGFFVMQNEIWKDIKGYEGRYQISNFYRVKSLDRIVKHNNNVPQSMKGRFLKISYQNSKYKYRFVKLYKYNNLKNYKISRLIYQAFCGDLVPNMVIDHIDGDPLNDSPENLQQITNRENCSKDKWRRNPKSNYAGVTIVEYNRWVAVIQINKKQHYIGSFDTEIEANNAYQAILKDHTKINNYKNKKHGNNRNYS